jgi:hypothetical protein
MNWHRNAQILLMLVMVGIGAATPRVSQRTSSVVLFPPVDEAVRDPELMAVRSAILRAAVTRNVTALEPWLAADFEGGAIDRWLTISARGKLLLEGLSELLTFGGAFVQPDLFCAPFWHANRIDHLALPDHLIFEGLPWVVVLPRTAVYAKPDHNSRVIGRLQLQLIRADYPPVGEFNRVRFDGQQGYVDSAALVDPNEDRRACLGRRDGEWRLVRFDP